MIKRITSKALFRSPWLEVIVICAVVLVSFCALMLITKGAETPPGGLSLNSISVLVFGFFLLSFAIAVIAVMAGIGGGVVFTPIMLAFTPVNSLIVRGTGLIVAMFSGLISGFFGLGAGWAIVPVMNLIMAVPLKVAAACSGNLIGMGDCISVWPYIFAGAVIFAGVIVALFRKFPIHARSERSRGGGR